MGKLLCVQLPARKTALSIPSASAKVSPANVLCTTLLIHFHCQHIGGNFSSSPISIIKCPPCVPPPARFPIEESLNTISLRELFSPKPWNLKITSSDSSFLISLFAQCRVWTVACFVLDAKMDMSHIMSGLLCLATHNIWTIFDFSMSILMSVKGTSRYVALVGSTTMGCRFFMYVPYCTCIPSSRKWPSILL